MSRWWKLSSQRIAPTRSTITTQSIASIVLFNRGKQGRAPRAPAVCAYGKELASHATLPHAPEGPAVPTLTSAVSASLGL